MINYDPNMSRKQIMDEMLTPSKLGNDDKNPDFWYQLIYKGVFIAIKLLLDIRLNLVKISEGKTINTNYKKVKKIKQPNAVIKDTDKIK